jgi:hypothetical protein
VTIKGKTNNGSLNTDERNEVKGVVRHILRLDEDLSGFYKICKKDPQLRFVIFKIHKLNSLKT